MRLAFSLVAFFFLPGSGRITQRGDAHRPVGELPDRSSLGRPAHTALQHFGDVEQALVSGRGCAASTGGMKQRQQMLAGRSAVFF